MMRHSIFFGLILPFLSVEVRADAEQPPPIGLLQLPLKTKVKITGIVHRGPYKGTEGGPNVLVQRINGKAWQRDVRIKLAGHPIQGTTGMTELPKTEFGKTYEMEGYEDGQFVGDPPTENDKLVQSSSGRRFVHRFHVLSLQKIEAQSFGPADFGNEPALLEGVALTKDHKATISAAKWTIIVDSKVGWPNDIENKTVECMGTYKATEDSQVFLLDRGSWRLLRLADQVGRKVELLGLAQSKGDVWWLRYRGIDVGVEGMRKLPGWNAHLHGKPVVIRGVLERAKTIEQLPWPMPIRDFPEGYYYYVRDASWEAIPALLAPENPLPEQLSALESANQ